LSATPRAILIAAASSHSGKTVLTAGLVAALRRRGLGVRAAKCGPDYIDPKFLEAASDAHVVNLDAFAMSPQRLRALAAGQAAGTDLLVVEGVMGLFDGGAGGLGSTASVARALGLPVVLVAAADGMSQSAGAVAEGFARLADGFEIAGAIVNRAGSERHRALICEGFQRSCVPLLGTIPRERALALPSRHLGLVQAEEQGGLSKVIARAAELMEANSDLDAVLSAAVPLAATDPAPGLPPLGQRIAVADDVAFRFAYPHMLSGWRDAGAEIAFFSPLAGEAPDENADAVFLPGGYPELHAAKLAAATSFHAGLGAAAERGARIYGECGGFMALGEALIDADGVSHEMTGLLPLVTSFADRKLHLGYRRVSPLAGTPFAGRLAAHEFHYASIVSEGAADRLFAVEDAAGADLGKAGLRRGSVMGSFLHVIDPVAT